VHRKEFFHGLCVAQVQCRLERVKNQLCTRMFVHVLGLMIKEHRKDLCAGSMLSRELEE
jgi:hypothetical protein